MRILHVITTIERGGAENQLLILVGEQLKQNHVVSIYYLKGENHLESSFRHLGAQVIRSKSNGNPLSQVLELRRLTRDSGLLVHAHLPRAELLVALSNPKGVFVVSRHNSEPFFPGAPRWISKKLSLFVTNRSSQIISITKTVAEYLRKIGEVSPKKNISVVYYGYPKQENLKNKNRFSRKIGTVSRLAPQKDLPTLLKAFEIVLRDQPDLSLEVYGEGAERETLENLAKKLQIESSVNFLGKTEFVNEAMSGLDLFILTSRYEGFGLVLLEAMSNEVPIVCSNSEAALEVLGLDFPLFFQIGDYKSLAKVVLKMLATSDDKILEYQSNRLLLFSPEKMESEISRVYFN